jgi:hypothetical protein
MGGDAGCGDGWYVVQATRPPRPSTAPVLRRSSVANVSKAVDGSAKPPMPRAEPMAVDSARASHASLAGSTLSTLRAKYAPNRFNTAR